MKQQKRLRDRTEKGKCTNKRERRVGLSTLVNPFHTCTEHDLPDVIGLDNNTAMLLANSKTITDDVTLTLPYVSFQIFSPCTKIYSHTRLYNVAASLPSRPREGDSLATSVVLFTVKRVIAVSVSHTRLSKNNVFTVGSKTSTLKISPDKQKLLYIEPTISFLIVRKRTVNFQNQYL